MKFCFLSICTVAWPCSHACPGRRWPTCFDQTCGYPGEGPLTTLDSLEAPEPSLTPTQELRTCCMVRRKTKGGKWKNQVCRACESSLTPKKNGYPSLGKFMKFCLIPLCAVAWFCSSAHPGRHWPTCFDQTCGYPGEGPLTTLDSPDAPAFGLTPTQEIRTCDVVRRRTKGKRWGNEVCRACESFQRMTVAMTLAEKLHHTSRGQKLARVGEEVVHDAHDAPRGQKTPPPGGAARQSL